jgi:hypothetical protein
MKRLLLTLLLVPGIAQAQFTLTATDIANSNIRIPIRMVDSTDHVSPETGLTPTCTRSINGAAKASCTGTITEIGTGDYYFTPAAAEYVAGSHIVTVVNAGADTFTATYRVSSGISDKDFSSPQLTAESGTTLTLAASAVAVDDQFNNGFVLNVYDYTSKGLKASSCIVDSTNTGETVVTAEDISARITGAGGSADYYGIVGDPSCGRIRRALLNKTDFNKSTGDFNIYDQDGATVDCDRTLTDNGTTATAGACD